MVIPLCKPGSGQDWGLAQHAHEPLHLVSRCYHSSACTACKVWVYNQSGRGSHYKMGDRERTQECILLGLKLGKLMLTSTLDTGGYASGGFSDQGSDPGQGFPEDSLAELDQWADLAAAGDRAFPGGAPPAQADAESMSYEELCQAHIEAFIQVAV